MKTVHQPVTVGDIVHAQGALRPDSPAILAPGLPVLRRGTLSELVREVEADLRESGIGPANAVAVALPNGPEMASAFLSLASCAVCAPLNPRLTERDHAAYLAELGPKAVVVSDGMPAVEAGARSAGIPTIRLVPQPENGAGWFRLCVSVPTECAAGGMVLPDGTALVLPTSGTTARPKLVPISHRNLSASARNIRNTLALTESDRCLNMMPLFHIHGLIAALLSSLSAGAAVVCTAGFSARGFLSWLNEFQPTWYTAVPTIHQSVLQCMAGARESLGTRLRLIRSSSAPLPPRVMAELESLFETPVIESYGMTEAAHQMASNPLPPAVRKPGSVGLPAGPEIALMDDQGRLLADGGTGEIVIRGENVVSGYLNNEAANRHAFCDGWFRTGDQGRFDENGYLYLTGRMQELINRGGEKIAPREIEDVLLEHPAVAQAVSFAVPHRTLGEDVGAAVVARAGSLLAPTELRHFAAARLPAFKVPRVIRVVPDIPKGPTGKLQRIGLSERLGIGASAGAAAPEEYLPPATELEQRLALVWQETLRVDRVVGSDDFFALGGDSLSAVEMLVRVSVEEDVVLPQVSLYECPTLRAFSAMVQNALQERSSLADKSRGLVPVRVGGSLPPLFVATNHLDRFGQFCRLARYLGPDQPVFGFPPPVLDKTRKHFRVDSLAASFVELIRTVKPHGPYYLMGDCFGGFVVYETACQLEAAGERIAFLGLMNAYCSTTGGAEVGRDDGGLDWNSFRRRLAFHRSTMSRLSPGQMIPFVVERCRALMRRMRTTVEWRCYRFLVRRGAPVPQFLLRPDFARTYALDLYRPCARGGGALLVRSIDDRSDDRLMGWQGLFGGQVNIIRVPHGLWTEEGVAVYGPEVLRRLDQARVEMGDSVIYD